MADGLHCHDVTVTGRPCRRRGAWLVFSDSSDGRFFCKQHARWHAAAAGSTCQIQHITGRVEDVTADIVGELVALVDAARDRDSFNRARTTIARSIRACKNERTGLHPAVKAALDKAKTRLGIGGAT